ncbi:unnamed protein product, partial [marine sediment metagenome]
AVTSLPIPTGTPRYQLVGFTADTFPVTTGVLGFTLACQVAFPESRMCTSNEVMETVTVPLDLSGEAWVRPSFVPIATGDNNVRAMDNSGNYGWPSSFTCSGWRSEVNDGYNKGLTVDATGRFVSRRCDYVYAVACCAPVP